MEDKLRKIEETIISLKIQKEKICNDQEVENFSLREELEKMSRATSKKYEEISKLRKEVQQCKQRFHLLMQMRQKCLAFIGKLVHRGHLC